MNAIEIKGLTKKYKNLVAVDNLDLTVSKGEIFALLGVNGAGKTTIIKMLTCVTRSDFGEAFINGNSIVTNAFAVKQIIGVSPQETAVAPNLTVKENLELMCGVYGFNNETKKEKVEKSAKQFSLNEILSKKAGKLSGGWQRRVSIAMALIGEPQILFLDEPTLGLDVIVRSELWDIIRELKGKITIVLTTHYMGEAEALADRIGIMRGGKLLALGSADELKKKADTNNFEEAFVKIVKGEFK